MAKNKYELLVLPKLAVIEAWAREGIIDEKIAEKLGIAYSTFREYVKNYPQLSAVIKRGKEVSDSDVENTLLKRALGFYIDIAKHYKLRRVEYDKDSGKKLKEYEELVEVIEQEYISPDITAIIFWLKNRKKESWKDNPSKIDIDKAMLELRKKQADKEDW